MAFPVAAAIAGGASILGGVMGGKGQKNAAKAAAKSAEKIAGMNNALAREMYNKNALRLDPYSTRGNQAGNVLQEILLGPQAVQASTTTPMNQAYDGAWAASAMGALLPHLQTGDNPDRGYNQAFQNYIAGSPIKYAAGGGLDQAWAAGALEAVLPSVQANAQSNPDRGISQTWGSFSGANPIKYATAAPATPATGTGGNALSAWDQFKQGSMYQNRLEEGQDAINSAYAARGALQSGAAMQALQEHGQVFASNELGNWMNMLANQQGVGLSAANALAGVGTNMVNQVSANNNSMGSAQANAALVSGSANQQMWGSIGQGIGTIAGALGSSYNPANYNAAQSGYSSPYSFYSGVGNYGGW